MPEELAFREAVMQRAGWRCEIGSAVCIRVAAHAHHVLPRSAGGGHEAENGLAACAPCHSYLHANPAEAYERNWLRRRGA